MAINIFSPQSVWANFNITQVNAHVISEKKIRDVVYTKIIIEGRKTERGIVQIAGYMAKPIDYHGDSAILLTNKSEKTFDEKLIIDLAKSGFMVLAVDLTGKDDEKEEYTLYPDDVYYANFDYAKKNIISATGDIFKTCWYEWGVSLRYAIYYLRYNLGVDKIGAVGVGNSATPVWHAIATTEDIACAVIVGNAGWRVYKNINKFSDELDPEFTDEVLQVLAGIEPQSYAKSVKCPVLTLSATNSFVYDVDRAFDTVERIEDEIYKAINYSVGYRDSIDNASYLTAKAFLKEFLLEKKAGYLPLSPEIKAELKDGKIEVEVTPSEKRGKTPVKPESVYLYVAEGVINPSLRAWKKIDGVQAKNKYLFEYTPYYKSQIATFFAKAVYENGYTVSSPIIAKKFTEQDVSLKTKASIIYSGRIDNSFSVFAGDFNGTFDIENKGRVVEKNGPMDIAGVRSEVGLITFKVNAIKDKPQDDALLMFDLFLKQDGEFSVSLISFDDGKSLEYTTTISAIGGKVWHNIKLEKSKFKTEEGRILKSYESVNAVKFKGDGVYLISNVLWV